MSQRVDHGRPPFPTHSSRCGIAGGADGLDGFDESNVAAGPAALVRDLGGQGGGEGFLWQGLDTVAARRE